MQLEKPNKPNEPLNQLVQDFLFDGPPKKEDVALKLVIQNTEKAEAYLTTRLWLSEWRVARGIYEAPVKQEYWRDTNVPRASNPYPLSSQHVRAICDTALPALFSEDQPFNINPTEGTPWEVTESWEGLLAYELKDTKFKQQVRLLMKDALIFGTGIGKWGWEHDEEMIPKYVRNVPPEKIESPLAGAPPTIINTKESDELELIEVKRVIDRPFFKRCEINHVLIDPSLREPDISLAKYIIYRDFLTLKDLNKLRGYEDWDIPLEADLKKLAEPPVESPPASSLENEGQGSFTANHRPMPRFLDDSEDPLDHKLEVLEYWTADSLIVVLDRKLVIRKMKNEFGRVPFVSAYWDDIPGTFYAFGIPRRIGGIQAHVQGLRNLRLDDILLNLQNMWKVKKGTEIAAQPIKAYPGAVFKVQDMESFEPLAKQPILTEAYKEEQVLNDDATKTTGANEITVQGGSSAAGKGTGMRNATGAGLVGAASTSRIQGFIDVLAENVVIPVLNAFASMTRDKMDPAVIRRVIGQERWQKLESSYKGDLLIDFLDNTDMQFTILAGANLAAKQKLAASLPLEMQMYMSPAVQSGLQQAGLKTNWIELVRRMEQVTGWKAEEDTVVSMNQQDNQRAMLSNKNVMNMKATTDRLNLMNQHKQQQEAQKQQGALQQIDAKGLANAGEAIITRAMERAAVRDEEPQIGDLEGE